MYYRVFGMNQVEVAPADLLEHLNRDYPGTTGHFKGDDSGWFHAILSVPGSDLHIEVQRYLAAEEGIRRQMNSWAAWIEETLGDEKGGPWMAKLINTTQILTLGIAEEEPEFDDALNSFLIHFCQYLASATQGLYQIDGRGMFLSDGSLLAAETL